MTSGIIHHEDVRDDDWLWLVRQQQVDIGMDLGCVLGISREKSLHRGPGKPLNWFARRKDFEAITIIEVGLGMNVEFCMSTYGFAATDTDIEELTGE